MRERLSQTAPSTIGAFAGNQLTISERFMRLERALVDVSKILNAQYIGSPQTPFGSHYPTIWLGPIGEIAHELDELAASEKAAAR